ncbi:hypothetical protein M438DRAFT_409366 [Aureobasidium pullulans EXF-150]|uniref:Uncharacterized protein n=1 Tax=Aureobasidium pullulans EXF-150 TaxID=1043002 RepID=A0A074XC91_AURPU|nr:uncharacterized protein M438DRAFT_409366 [Aureobasidium pullulans EXF-150]KEQ79627.1 hypothetical protein M438DRAFT_409366 [Aureobasidium pullulans EXF-150]
MDLTEARGLKERGEGGTLNHQTSTSSREIEFSTSHALSLLEVTQILLELGQIVIRDQAEKATFGLAFVTIIPREPVPLPEPSKHQPQAIWFFRSGCQELQDHILGNVDPDIDLLNESCFILSYGVSPIRPDVTIDICTTPPAFYRGKLAVGRRVFEECIQHTEARPQALFRRQIDGVIFRHHELPVAASYGHQLNAMRMRVNPLTMIDMLQSRLPVCLMDDMCVEHWRPGTKAQSTVNTAEMVLSFTIAERILVDSPFEKILVAQSSRDSKINRIVVEISVSERATASKIHDPINQLPAD